MLIAAINTAIKKETNSTQSPVAAGVCLNDGQDFVDLLDQDAEYEPLFDDAVEADDDDGLLDPMLR